MMKAVFKKLFKSSSKDKVAVATNNTNEQQQEGTSRNNVTDSPARRVKWWENFSSFALLIDIWLDVIESY